MSEYLFEGQQGDQEFARLQMVEGLFDPLTKRQLERAGLKQGQQCLELGAGAGSIMKWMGGIVGADGTVVGVDKSVNYLTGFTDPRFQVVEGDFLELEFQQQFDIVHCRYVLIHNQRSKEILQRLYDILKPGGMLVAEEPDFRSAKLLNLTQRDDRWSVNNAICRAFEERNLNPQFGLELPQSVAELGLSIVDVDARLHLARGGSEMSRMMTASLHALRATYLETGEVTENQLDQYIAEADDPQSWAVYYSTVSVIASKPA